MMNVPKSKLDLPGNETMDVRNVKCGPMLIESLRNEKGIYPAYRMNKANWITIALNGGVEDDKIKFLLKLSYE